MKLTRARLTSFALAGAMTLTMLVSAGTASASHSGCTTNSSYYTPGKLVQKANMVGCGRGKLVIGTEVLYNGNRLPGWGIGNVTCSNTTSCSTPTKVTNGCWESGDWIVLAL